MNIEQAMLIVNFIILALVIDGICRFAEVIYKLFDLILDRRNEKKARQSSE